MGSNNSVDKKETNSTTNINIPSSKIDCELNKEETQLICECKNHTNRKLFINFQHIEDLYNFSGSVHEKGLGFSVSLNDKKLEGLFDVFDYGNFDVNNELNYMKGTFNIDGMELKCEYDKSQSKNIICEYINKEFPKRHQELWSDPMLWIWIR